MRGRTAPGAFSPSCRALAYTDLVGTPEVGDTVLLDTGALDLGSGTGGYALVVTLPGRLPADHEGPGHPVKARYPPMQATISGAAGRYAAHCCDRCGPRACALRSSSLQQCVGCGGLPGHEGSVAALGHVR